MITATWIPQGMVLSERELTHSPAVRREPGHETPTMSSADLAYGSMDWLFGASSNGIVGRWIEAHLTPLMRLGANWDLSGGIPITEVAAADARNVLSQLLSQGVQTPSLVPRPDGGIAIEWLRPSFEFAIELPGALGLRSASAYLMDTVAGIEWEEDLAMAMPRVVQVLTSLVQPGF